MADDGKMFLEKFYQEGTNCFFDGEFLKKHLTKKALAYLHDNYDYDDDTGEGLATWLFYQEGGWDLGDFKEILVKKIKENTYEVLYRSKFNEDVYEYPVQLSLKKLTEWANQPNRQKPSRQGLGDWIFQESNNQEREFRQIYRTNNFQSVPSEEEMTPLETQSLTPNAIQLDWKHPVEFPCCPTKSPDNSLKQYMANLEKGKVFSKNDYGSSIILNYGMPDPNHLWVMSKISIGFKTHGFTRITYKDGVFYHEYMGVYDIGDNPEEIFENILFNRK